MMFCYCTWLVVRLTRASRGPATSTATQTDQRSFHNWQSQIFSEEKHSAAKSFHFKMKIVSSVSIVNPRTIPPESMESLRLAQVERAAVMAGLVSRSGSRLVLVTTARLYQSL